MKTHLGTAILILPWLVVGLSACSGGNSNKPDDKLDSESVIARDRLNTLLDSLITEPNVINTMVSVNNGLESGTYSVEKGEASPGIPMTAEHQFHIASMTKPFTATLLLQLVEEGELDLDTPLLEIFGNQTMEQIFPNHVFTRNDPNGLAVADMTIDQLQRFDGIASGGSITVRQLMQHTHGMPDLTFDAPMGEESLAGYTILKFSGLAELDPTLFPDQWSGVSLLEYYLGSGLPTQSLFPINQGYHYGDTGPVVAALIIEKTTGMSLAEAYRTRIFDPLGMDDTYLHHYEEPRQSRSAGIAHRYFDLTGLLEGAGNIDVDADNWNTSIDWAGGGLVSTSGDINRFFRGLFNGQLLEDVSVIGDTEYRVEGDEEAPVYGLGIALQLSPDESTVVSYEHSGFWGSYMMYVPATQTSLSFTANQVMFDRYDEFLTEARSLLLTLP